MNDELDPEQSDADNTPPADQPEASQTREHRAISRGSGKWGGSAWSKKGWSYDETIDHGEVAKVCEMCEHQPIRYEYRMTHPDHPGITLGCGEICSGYMQEDMAAANARHKESIRSARAAKAKAEREAEAEAAAQKAKYVAKCRALYTPRQSVPPAVNRLKLWQLKRLAARHAEEQWQKAPTGNWWRRFDNGWRSVVRWDAKYQCWNFMLVRHDDPPQWDRTKFRDIEAAQQAAEEKYRQQHETAT